MALKGNLRDFSFTQLLNLINLAKKTGSLIIERSGQTVRFYFLDGKLAYAIFDQDNKNLIGVLLRAKKIGVHQAKAIQERAARMSDKELGLLLVNANYFSQQDIISCLQEHVIQIVNQMFGWSEGVFHFETGVPPPEGKITLRINLENQIIEGVRRMREWEQLKDEIPSLDMALRFTERPGSNIRNLSLKPEEWKVISYINPKNTIKQIAQANKLNDMDIRKIVFSLLQAGLVELVRPVTVPVYARPITPALANASKQEQQSLVNRLIQRIRSI